MSEILRAAIDAYFAKEGEPLKGGKAVYYGDAAPDVWLDRGGMSKADDLEEAETRAELIEWWDNQPTCLSCGLPQGKGHMNWCLRKKMQKKVGKWY